MLAAQMKERRMYEVLQGNELRNNQKMSSHVGHVSHDYISKHRRLQGGEGGCGGWWGMLVAYIVTGSTSTNITKVTLGKLV